MDYFFQIQSILSFDNVNGVLAEDLLSSQQQTCSQISVTIDRSIELEYLNKKSNKMWQFIIWEWCEHELRMLRQIAWSYIDVIGAQRRFFSVLPWWKTRQTNGTHMSACVCMKTPINNFNVNIFGWCDSTLYQKMENQNF